MNYDAQTSASTDKCYQNLDLEQKVANVYDSFTENIDYYLATERSLFRRHIAKIIIVRSPASIEVPPWECLWEKMGSVLASFLMREPEHFCRYCKHTYLDTLLSLQRLKQHTIEKPLAWIDDRTFVDCDFLKNPALGKSTPLNTLKEASEYRATSRKSHKQYRLREVMLALIGCFDYEKLEFEVDGPWQTLVDARDEKKLVAKEKYLSLLDRVWQPRQLGKILQARPIKHRARGDRISIDLWQDMIRQTLHTALVGPDRRNLVAVQSQLLPIYFGKSKVGSWGYSLLM